MYSVLTSSCKPYQSDYISRLEPKPLAKDEITPTTLLQFLIFQNNYLEEKCLRDFLKKTF